MNANALDIVPAGSRPIERTWSDESDDLVIGSTKASDFNTNVWPATSDDRVDTLNSTVDNLVDHISKLLAAQETRLLQAITAVVASTIEDSVDRFCRPQVVSPVAARTASPTGSSNAPWYGYARTSSKASRELQRLLDEEHTRSERRRSRTGMRDIFSTEVPEIPQAPSPPTLGGALQKSSKDDKKLKRQATVNSRTSWASSKSLTASSALRKTDSVVAANRKKTKVAEEIIELSKLANEISQQGQAFALRHSTLDFTKHFSLHDGFTNAVWNVMNSRPIELIISTMIVGNAASIGVQVDYQMKNPSADPEGGASVTFRVFDIFFMAVFTIELFLRLVGEHFMEFFSWNNEKFSWNVFDTILVLSAFGEEVMKRFADSTPDVSTLRLFRILRLVRVFRIIRVMRFFRDLRIMVAGIAQSMQSLVWALLLLFCIMYLVAVCVMQIAVEESESKVNDSIASALSENDFEDLMKYFGALDKTMYTLFKAILGGLDWGDASDPLFRLTWVVGGFFCVYISFSVLCVLNIVTGVFVENCNKMTARDQDMVLMEQLETRRQWFEEVRGVFDAADANANGSLDACEFVEKLACDVRMQAWLRKLGIQVEAHSAEQLFTLLDMDGDGQLDFDEFASALQQVHGHARSIDLARIKHDTGVLRASTAEVRQLCGMIYQQVTAKDDATQKPPSFSRADSNQAAQHPDKRRDEVSRLAATSRNFSQPILPGELAREDEFDNEASLEEPVFHSTTSSQGKGRPVHQSCLSLH